MAISPFQIKSELEDDIILRETERPCVPSRSVTASRPSQSTNNTRNFVFPTTSVKDEPISFVNYSPVEEDNCEQYDSRNSTGNYNQSLETPALLQRWSEENLNVDPTGDTSFLISSNSTSVSQQPLGGMRSSNSQSRLSEGASTTRESQSSTGVSGSVGTFLPKMEESAQDTEEKTWTDPVLRRQENARRRQLYEATKKALKSNEDALRASGEALKSSKEAWKSSEKALKSSEVALKQVFKFGVDQGNSSLPAVTSNDSQNEIEEAIKIDLKQDVQKETTGKKLRAKRKCQDANSVSRQKRTRKN